MTAEHFKTNVFEAVRSILAGETRSYKEISTQAGNPNASRAVGAILRTNYDSDIPCHRVIKSDGTVGGYNRGSKEKERILKKEKRLRI